MNFLLRLEAWQLFLLLILPLMFSSIPVIGDIFYLLAIGIYIGWVYSVGTAMHELIPIKSKPNVTYFKYHCLCYVITAIVVYILSAYLGDIHFLAEHRVVFVVMSFVIASIFLYLSFSIWMFAARMLESMIQGEIVNRSDSIKAFFCFWIYPVGVWHIQPAVLRVLDKYESDDTVESK